MKKFFSFMKDLVVSSEGSESVETSDYELAAGPDDEFADVTAVLDSTEECENSAATAQKPESGDAEQMTESEVVLVKAGDNACEQDLSETKTPMPVITTIAVEPKRDSATPEPDATTNSVSEEQQSAVIVQEIVKTVSPRGDTTVENLASRSSGGSDAAVAAASEDLRTASIESDSSSWEPKAKDVKMALTEKGDNKPVSIEAERSAGKVSKPDVIHPLQNSWGIWCFMQNRCQDWHENVRHISNFSSVEDFWSLLNHIQTVDNLPIGCDYYIFKANIQPMWEDRANVNGGRWLLKVPQAHPNFVNLWNETLLLLVGEAFESESDSICGAVAQVRRGFNKISIWTREAGDRNACMRIGYRWKNSIKTNAPIHYEAHLEVNRKGGGRRSKSVYLIN